MGGIVIRVAVICGAFLLCSGINDVSENNFALLIVCNDEGGTEPNCADIQNELSASNSRNGRDRDDGGRRRGVIRVRRPGPVRVTIIPLGNGMFNPGNADNFLQGMGNFGPGMGLSGPGMVNSGPGMGNSGPGMVNTGPGMVNTGTGMVNTGTGMVNTAGIGMVNTAGIGMGNFGPTNTRFGQGGFRRPITGVGGNFRPIRRRIPGQGFRRRGTGGFRRRRPVFGGRRRVGVRRPTGEGDFGPRRGDDRPVAPPVIGRREPNGGRRRTPLP